MRHLAIAGFALLFAANAFAADLPSQGTTTEFVSGYTRADGTHVESHYRLPAAYRLQAATSAGFGHAAATASLAPVSLNTFRGVSGSAQKTAYVDRCDYKHVMSDSDIAACRAQ